MAQNDIKALKPANPVRRSLLRTAGAAALAAPVLALPGGILAAPAVVTPSKTLSPLSFAWNQVAFCSTSIPVAKETGIFEKHGLDVSLINYTGTSDQLLESLASGKADAAIGMIHLWLKPLESGFDVKIIGSVHGGCIRLVGYKPANVTKLEDLRGKTIGVASLAAPGKHFFSVYLKKHGIDPERDVTWSQYQRDLLGVAAEKGEIHAIVDQDPQVFSLQKHSPGNFVEIATNKSGEYHNKVCCVLGAGGNLLRKNKATVSALLHAIEEATEYTANNIDQSARIFQKYTPNISVEDLAELYGTLTLHHHPGGKSLRDEIAFFAEDFRTIGVLKKTTDPQKLADHVFADVY
jgi:NitT/TauT family transport system substrate-binding protein